MKTKWNKYKANENRFFDDDDIFAMALIPQCQQFYNVTIGSMYCIVNVSHAKMMKSLQIHFVQWISVRNFLAYLRQIHVIRICSSIVKLSISVSAVEHFQYCHFDQALSNNSNTLIYYMKKIKLSLFQIMRDK